MEDAVAVDGEHPPPAFVAGVGNRLHRQRTGHIGAEVYRPPPLLHGRHQRVDGGAVRHIQRCGPEVLAGAAFGGGEVRRDDASAFVAQLANDGGADSAGRTGHQRNAAAKARFAFHGSILSDNRGAISAEAAGPVSCGCRKGTSIRSSPAA